MRRGLLCYSGCDSRFAAFHSGCFALTTRATGWTARVVLLGAASFASATRCAKSSEWKRVRSSARRRGATSPIVRLDRGGPLLERMGMASDGNGTSRAVIVEGARRGDFQWNRRRKFATSVEVSEYGIASQSSARGARPRSTTNAMFHNGAVRAPRSVQVSLFGSGSR